ncbi:fibroblast growth factor 2 [Exaiptasia diaphana]|uniref:FGF n=1 Tax=Exaiptasia diaphana TaxID=2652724 RepID=A0A913X4D8_EXADI|nr:fibroblast growth factor 2 [Exaiptasia diaphana]
MNGDVSGTSNCSLPTVKMEMFSAGLAGVKLIKGIASNRFLAMDKYGAIYSTKTKGKETLFFEKLVTGSGGYSTFASYKFYQQTFYDTLVAVNRNGRMRVSTNRSKNGVQFSVLRPSSLGC